MTLLWFVPLRCGWTMAVRCMSDASCCLTCRTLCLLQAGRKGLLHQHRKQKTAACACILQPLQCFDLFRFRWPWHRPGFLWVLPGHLPPAALRPNAVVCIRLERQRQGNAHFKRGWYGLLVFVFCDNANNRLPLYSSIFWPTQTHCALQHFLTFF